MNHYKVASLAGNTIALGIAVVLGTISNDWLKKFPLPYKISLAYIFAVVVVSRLAIPYLFDLLFENFRLLRRLLLWRQFVEGTWIIEIKSNNELVGIAVSRIEPAGTSLRWSGEHYDLEGNLKGSVYGEVLEIKWPRIRYTYDSHRGGESTPSHSGYGQRQFVERDGIPLQFSGYYIDLLGKRYDTEAWKVESKELLRELDSRARCKEYIRSYNPKSPDRTLKGGHDGV